MKPYRALRCSVAVCLLSGFSSLVAGLDLPAALPFRLQDRLPTVDVTIDGHTFSLFFDLGGFQGIALTREALAAISVEYTSETDRWRDSTGAFYESRKFIAKNVSIGKVSLGDLDGGEFFLKAAATSGYIGFGFLRNYLLVFDHPHGMLRLYDKDDTGAFKRECGNHQFKLQVVNGVVQSLVVAGPEKLIFEWDTGSTQNIVRPSAIGRTAQDGLHTIRKFNLGKTAIGPVVFELREFKAPAVDGVLGTDFFQSRVVCFDLKRGRGAVN